MLALLFLSLIASAAPATILRYEDGTSRYAIEKSAKEISMIGGPAPMRIAIKPCNREIVNAFWNEVEWRHKSLPEISSRSTASMDNVDLGGKKRALLSLNSHSRKASRFFRYMARTFYYTQLKSESQCRR